MSSESDLVLRSDDDQAWSLSQALARGPLALAVFRGHW